MEQRKTSEGSAAVMCPSPHSRGLWPHICMALPPRSITSSSGTAGTGSGSHFQGGLIRNLIVACALALTATVASAPANALSGPIQGPKLQNAASDVERVVVVRRTYLGRGPHGSVVVGRTTAWVRPSWYRWGPGGATIAGR